MLSAAAFVQWIQRPYQKHPAPCFRSPETDRVSPTFTKEDNDIFIAEQFYGRRLPRFQHQHAKEIALKLVKKRVAFYD